MGGKGKRSHFENETITNTGNTCIITPTKIPSIPLLSPISLPKVTSKPTTYNTPSKINYELNNEKNNAILESPPFWVIVTTYLSYAILIMYGRIRDFFGYKFGNFNRYNYLKSFDGYAPIVSGFDTFYQRRLYLRIRDCFHRPVTDVPGRFLTLLDRTSEDYNRTFKINENSHRKVLNLSSYNYLGFAQATGTCADFVQQSIKKYGISTSSSRFEVGSTDLHLEAENLVAKFLGQEASMIVSMGFATNSTSLPALVSKGCLIISDELNHTSLVYGARVSGANIKIFKHNDVKDLEKVLRDSISKGQPRTHRPWKKILVVVEGLYSMEGSFCNLTGIVALKKKYKFYLYLDEAHSVGAIGSNGRGLCDYLNIDPCEVDILMGTFTKSFGAAGGYLAGKRELIDHIRFHSHSNIYAESTSPAILAQIISSMKVIMGEDGTQEGKTRIENLNRNSRIFSKGLMKLGFIIYGNSDSPVIPLLIFHPAKLPAFSREMLKRGIAVVVVSYPATPIITSRVRFCISASHTIEDLEMALAHISEVGDLLDLKHSKRDNLVSKKYLRPLG